MKTDFKKNIRRDLYKNIKENYVPTGMVWRVKDPHLARNIENNIRNSYCDTKIDFKKPVTIIKNKTEKQVIIERNRHVFDMNGHEIGRAYSYINTKSGEPLWGVYIAETHTNMPKDVKVNTLHTIENIYLKGTKLIYQTDSIRHKGIINGCCIDVKEKEYVSMDFSNNKFYHITCRNNKKSVKRISPYLLSDYLPWDIRDIKNFIKITENLTGIKDFNFSSQDIQKYLIKWYEKQNINYPAFTPGYLGSTIINTIFKKSLNWKNPVKHITRETRGYGKKIRKIIFANPWKLEIFKSLKPIKNLDTIQKILSNEYCANIYLMFNMHMGRAPITYLETLPESMKIKLLTKIYEYISTNNTDMEFHTVRDILYSIERLHKSLEESELEKINLSGTIPEIDIRLSNIIYELTHTRNEFIYDDKTSPYRYINNTRWEMKIPKDNFELHNWGEKFHNCVGGYDYNIERRKSNIVTFWENDTPVLCVEIHPENGYVNQAYGTCNSSPDKITDTEFIENFVRVNKLNYKNDPYRKETVLNNFTEAGTDFLPFPEAM